jgi:hypothetical protein
MIFNNVFDVAFTGTDRIITATIPAKCNIDDNDSFFAFKSFALKITRSEKTFADNEPFAASIFCVESKPSKIAFTLAALNRIIEFYKDC